MEGPGYRFCEVEPQIIRKMAGRVGGGGGEGRGGGGFLSYRTAYH